MKDLFQRIEELVPQIPGWCEPAKAQALAAMVVALRPALVVEIGVFGGRSLLPMALAAQAVGHGRIIGIDPWAAAAATAGYDGPNAAWWASVDFERIYRDFLNLTAQLNVGDRVQAVRAPSDEAPVPSAIDLLHVDGQHTDQAVRDVRRFGAVVRVGGLCVMDDIAWAGGGVARGVEALKALGFTELYPLGTGAVFQRVA